MNNINQFNVDSKILEESNRKEEFLNLIYEWAGCKNMQLLYRGTKDGMTSKHFHEICDNQGKTITLYRNIKGYIFGGFASIPWSTETGTWKSAPESFIFTLTNVFNIRPTKLQSKHDQKADKEVYHNINYGPTFGNDVGLYEDFTKSSVLFSFSPVRREFDFPEISSYVLNLYAHPFLVKSLYKPKSFPKVGP